MTSGPETEVAPSDDTEGATQERTLKPEQTAADLRQREAVRGSYSQDDPNRPRWVPGTVVESVHDYHHADGRYAYSKIKGRRSDGEKAFLTGRLRGGNDLQIEMLENPEQFYRSEGLTHYLKGKGDEPDLPYRLHELTQAKLDRPTAPVCIAEGEKDADKLWELGFIATTNPDGAGKWREEFNTHLADRDINVIADNDPVGRKHAAKVADSVLPVARSVKVIKLPGLKSTGDFTDWIEAGRTADDFMSVVEQTDALEDFARDDDGRPYATPRNARLALARSGWVVRYNEFACRHEIIGLRGFGSSLDDAALTRMRLSIEERWRLGFGKDRWCDIVTDHARRQSYNPVTEYLDGLRWDGVERVDGWLPSYGGAEDTAYVRAVGAIFLIAATRRVRQPGCKFDEMLVLESEQGTNKSSALATLAICEEWFTDDVPLDADSKVLMERIAGRWLVEMAEMKGLKRSEVESVKSTLSRRVDKARMAYGRMTTEQPRQCVFVGTTNDSAYLRDMTGNRRFWPVRVQAFNLLSLVRDRDQLWAEAAAREAKGESIRLPESLWAEAGVHQAGREITDPFFDLLGERLEGLEGKIRAADIWLALGLDDAGRRTQDHNVRLGAVMQKMGWRRPKSKLRFDGKPQNAWIKGEEGLAVTALDEVPRAAVLGIDAHGNDGRPM